MYKNTKYWCFTWGTTVTKKKFPNEAKLKKFLNNITEVYVFTNDKLDEHISKLSSDRWLRLYINFDYSSEFRKGNGMGH